MQIYSVAKNVLGALGPKVKVPVLDSELKIPAECLRIVGALDAGAVIESGENANGRYIKYADGTQICHGHFYHAFNTTDIFQAIEITYPAVFITDNDISGAAYHESAPGRAMQLSNFASYANYVSLGFSAYDGTPSSTVPVRIRWHAIGRWK
ncbi:hypothetical protein BED41_10430 [Cloacibacillus porcorum]|uniref:Uncharacterized protein n=2 Tax=Cloacibacillus porcorum TaxID=1197717 RepID=A0A1B2I644_9BACT|nr:hypothetical protein [Cloacibacillus porcorum]ANZ45445.1 hypothetical protein BED41_10430 [Cloacibacillus porcorum]